MFDRFFSITTMHLVPRGEGVQTMGAEKEVGYVRFLKDPREDDPRAACQDPEKVEKLITELLGQGKEDAMASLRYKDIEVQVSFEYGRFEWVYYEFPL